MKKYYFYCFLFSFLSITAISAQIQIPEGYVPGNRTLSASLEKNILFNAKTRYNVTEEGMMGFNDTQLAELFDGLMAVNYTWNEAVTTANPLVITIENLPAIHTQVGAWIGFSTRYWPAHKFKIEGYNSWPGNTMGWITLADESNNEQTQYATIIAGGIYTKIRFIFSEGCQTSAAPIGQMGLSELYFIHPEAAQAYDGLLLKCDASGSVGIGTTTPRNKLQLTEASQTELSGTDQDVPISNMLLDGTESGRTVGKGPSLTFRMPANTDGSNPWAQARILATPDNTNNGDARGRLYLQVRDAYNPGTGGSWNWRTGMMIAANGSIGIGTTAPQSKLQINNWANSDDFQTARQLVISGDNWGGAGLDQLGPAANKYGLEIGFHYKYNSETVKGGRIQAYSNGVSNLMLNPDGGNVGIGTTTPQAKLDVGAFIDNGQTGTVFGRLSEGNPTGDGTYLGVKGYGTNPANYNGKSFSIEHHFYGHTNSSINFFRGGGETGGFLTFNTSDNSEKMRIDPYGRVGIGTDSPDEMLTVKGKIHTNEVIIDMKDPIADFVFHPSYKLMPLTQVEQYVKTNSHLPEIPSAAEVSKNGMSIGDMQNKLLQKVEELTLYAIEQEKGKKELEKKYDALLEKIELLNEQTKNK